MIHLLITGGAGFIGASFARYVYELYPKIRIVRTGQNSLRWQSRKPN